MKVSDLYVGCSVMQKPKFIWNKPDSWLGVPIKFMDNLFRKIKNPYTHILTIALKDGELYAFEAINKYHGTPIKERFIDLERYLVLKPCFYFDLTKVSATAICLEGKRYNFVGVVWSEFVYMCTDERFWIGARSLGRTVFCTESTAYIYYKSTAGELYPDFYEKTPNDFYFSDLYKHEFLTK